MLFDMNVCSEDTLFNHTLWPNYSPIENVRIPYYRISADDASVANHRGDDPSIVKDLRRRSDKRVVSDPTCPRGSDELLNWTEQAN